MTSPELEREIAQLIVESLQLEDVQAESIEADAPLFVEGLGLDSIDALELATALEARYGVKFSRNSTNAQSVFRSVRSLAEYVAQQRAQ